MSGLYDLGSTPQVSRTAPDITALEHSWLNGNTTILLKNSQGGLSRFIPTVNYALDINRGLFDEAPSFVSVVLCNSQEEWRKHAKGYENIEFAWGVALDDGTLVVKTAECAGIEFIRFERVITHEMNHGFWLINFGSKGAGWCPIWIVEGLANLAAPARDLKSPQEIVSLMKAKRVGSEALEFQYRDMSNAEELIFYYSLWRSVVNELCPNGDIVPLMRCVREFLKDASEDGFKRAFRDQFGCELEQYFRQFVERNVTE